jgi:histidinol-phosphate/aromatic aminotransferase/cobyric acid decarboxylase-like protein
MNFAEFQQSRGKILRERESVLDCAETNLYRALARLVPPTSPPPTATIHRCHLAAEWAECFGITNETARRVLVSCGVRDSLAILFQHYAGANCRLWIPGDNYPVYSDLARAAGLATSEFPTLNEIIWPDANPASAGEVLLVTNPLKPAGRWLNSRDVQQLEAWLAQDARRRLLLDAVYAFGTEFHPTTLRLLETRQAILLHSVTKGWLLPRLFGVALVPEADFITLAPVFRAKPPSQQNLSRARELLTQHRATPAAVATALACARKQFVAAMPQTIQLPTGGDAPGYFFPVGVPWQTLLDRHGVLGLPASVFGSQREDIAILSSLKFTA